MKDGSGLRITMIIATSFGVSNWPRAVDRKFSMSPRLAPRPGLPSAPRRLNEFKIDTGTKVGLRVTKLIMRGEWKRRLTSKGSGFFDIFFDRWIGEVGGDRNCRWDTE